MRRATLTRFFAVLVAAAAVAALISATRKEASASDAAREPPFCTSAGVERVVRDFIDGFNRGDRRLLNLRWVRLRFQWFATTVRKPDGETAHHVEYTRRGLFRYFAERHRHRERMALAEFDYIGYSAAWGHFAFRVLRKADDLAGGRWVAYRGMGAVSCLKGPTGVARWTMSREA